MNKVILMGRLTRNPQVSYSQGASATTVARFSLAVDRKFKREGEPDADFFNCSAFGKQADFVDRFLKQGTKIVVVGRIQNDNYTNKEGQKVYSVQIMVDEIEFAESKNAAGSNNGNTSAANQDSYQQSSRPEPSVAAGDGYMNIPDGLNGELPFV